MKLYKIFGILVDFLIIVFIMALCGEILKLFITDVNNLFSNSMFLILLSVISMRLAIYIFKSFKNDNTIGKKIFKKIFRNR